MTGLDVHLEASDSMHPPPSQQVLTTIDPRRLSDDVVFCLMQKGRTLTILEDLRPVFRMHTGIGGHLCGANQAETYMRPTVIKAQLEAMLSLFKQDVEKGSYLSLVFDETTGMCERPCIPSVPPPVVDVTDRHPVNLIVSSTARTGYIGTTFLSAEGSVNNQTVAGV